MTNVLIFVNECGRLESVDLDDDDKRKHRIIIIDFREHMMYY